MLAVRLAVAGLVAATLAVLPGGTSNAAGDPSGHRTHVVSRAVVFEVENTNATSVLCSPDNASYTVRGRLIGPRKDVLGADARRMNVLVHDKTAGSWFWHLRGHPSYDYATQLARAGETSLVYDRLGYDSSPLADGNATCLGAQADMLHQVVQHLKSGGYHFRHGHRGTPAAEHVVVHGHSVGAAIAEAEAAAFDDVDGLVLMSWTDSGASQRAVDEAAQQSSTCLKGEDYAPYGKTGADFRGLLFASAPDKIQRAAAARRNADPCGDALSLTQLVTSLNLTTRDIEAPVLLLFGGRDALTRKGAAQDQADAFTSSVSVTEHTQRGAGSALPLEKSAARTWAHVLRWLETLG
jgi:pimeloyl-ACP methyl ester carboxylesterase